MPEQSLWRLRAEGWRKVTLPSFVYQWLTDIDGDGRVEFEGELAHASYRHCTYIACGSSMENAISVKGYFGWDGARFVPNRATYRRLYSERYADALKLVRSKAGISQSECNEEVLQAIGEVVIYGRMLRHSQSEWLGAIDATMRKSTNAECKPGDDDEHNQTLEFTPWSRIRASLLSEKVAPF